MDTMNTGTMKPEAMHADTMNMATMNMATMNPETMHSEAMHTETMDSGTMSKALKGAIAGGIATWIMDRVDWFMFNHEDPAARRLTEHVRPGGMDPAHATVNKMAEAMGKELHPKQPHPAGIAMHYALGILPGALYGATRERFPAMSAGSGSVFGLGVFLLNDEVLNTVTGSGADPRAYPWQAHARGLISHLVYGVATEMVLNLMEAPQRRKRSGY